MLTLAKLRTFDEERFYSVLDVALDIQGELDFRTNPILIQIMRFNLRFQALMPGDGIAMRDRYCELRWKAAQFLKAEGYLADVEWIEHSYDRWQGHIKIAVADEPEFHRLVVMLNEEEQRRDPSVNAQDLPSAMAWLEQLGDRFHRVALSLRSRHAGRPPFEVNNEYDVQDLFEALLHTRFDDIRPEEWTPSVAGKASRIDFLLKQEQIMVEMKMTREGLNDGRLGDELIIDSDKYKAHPDCKGLFCFVYDPEHRLKNPDAIESDLSRKTDGLSVRVQVRPKR
jgi:hypothetical protein